MKETKVDGVMIGRGATGKPWLFSQLKGENIQFSKIDVVKKHIQLLREHFDENWLKLYIRKHLLWYACDLPMSSELRLKLATCDNIDHCLTLLEKVFKQV